MCEKNCNKIKENFFEKSLAWLDKCSAWLKLDFRKMNSAWLGLSSKFVGLAWLKLEKIRLDPSLPELLWGGGVRRKYLRTTAFT